MPMPPVSNPGRAYAGLPYVPPGPQVGQRRGGRQAPRALGPEDAPADFTYDGRFLYYVGALGRLCTAAHGKKATWTRGCLCQPCRRAGKVHVLRGIREGHDGLVDPAPALERYQGWRAAGVSKAVIAASVGLVERTLEEMESGRAPRMRRRSFDRIMTAELDFEQVGYKTQIDAALTYRRLRSLCALGWTKTEILQTVSKRSFRTFDPAGDHPRCSAGFARDIRGAYAKLSSHAPLGLGAIQVRGARTKMKRMAAAHGWEVPAAWDDPGTLAYPQGWADEAPERDVLDDLAIEFALDGIAVQLTATEHRELYRRLLDLDPTEERLTRVAQALGVEFKHVSNNLGTLRKRVGARG